MSVSRATPITLLRASSFGHAPAEARARSSDAMWYRPARPPAATWVDARALEQHAVQLARKAAGALLAAAARRTSTYLSISACKLELEQRHRFVVRRRSMRRRRSGSRLRRRGQVVGEVFAA